MKLQEKHQLTKQISRLQKSVKRKYNAFKQGTLESDQLLEEQYKPLIKELRKTSSFGDSQPNRIKTEVKGEDNEDDGYKFHEEQKEVSNFRPNIHSSPQHSKTLVSNVSRINNEEDVFGDTISDDEDPDVSTHVSTREGIESASRLIENTFEHELTKRYMMKMMKDVGGHKHTIDHTFGPRYEDNTLTIGDSPLMFDEDGSIRVKGVRYKPTEGLYELIFKRIPDDIKYDERDLNAYKSILQATNAHKVNYSNQSRIRRDNSLKYQHVIRKLFPPRNQPSEYPKSFTGKGKNRTIKKSVSGSDNSRCGDPNTMTERLALLVTSAEVGNKGHKNEIINIIDSLKKDGIITGSGNERYWQLFQ